LSVGLAQRNEVVFLAKENEEDVSFVAIFSLFIDC